MIPTLAAGSSLSPCSEDIQISAGTGSFVKFANGVLGIGLFEDDDIDAFLFYGSQEAGTLGVLDSGDLFPQ